MSSHHQQSSTGTRHDYIELSSGSDRFARSPPRKERRTGSRRKSRLRYYDSAVDMSEEARGQSKKKRNRKKKQPERLSDAAEGKAAASPELPHSLKPAEPSTHHQRTAATATAAAHPPRAKVSKLDRSSSQELEILTPERSPELETARISSPTIQHFLPPYPQSMMNPAASLTQRRTLLPHPGGGLGTRMHPETPPAANLRGPSVPQSPQLSPAPVYSTSAPREVPMRGPLLLPAGSVHIRSPSMPPPPPPPPPGLIGVPHRFNMPGPNPYMLLPSSPQSVPDNMRWHERSLANPVRQFYIHTTATSPPPQTQPREKSSVGTSNSQDNLRHLQRCDVLIDPAQNDPRQQQPRVDSSQSNPTTQPLQVFPNPDAPDEVTPPPHPYFVPGMPCASSSISTRLSFTDVRGRRDNYESAMKKINSRLDAIIDDLASTGKFVPEHIVRGFKNKLIFAARRAGCDISDRANVEVMDKYSKIHGRIKELIHIFCRMTPITTLYELERSILAAEKEAVATFQEFRLGPLIKHPDAVKFFQPPSDLREIPKITAHQIQKMLTKFLDKRKRGGDEKQKMSDFLEFFAKSVSCPSAHHLCIRITSFPLAIQTNFAYRRTQKLSRDRVQEKINEEVQTTVAHEVDQVRRRLSTMSTRGSAIAAREPTTLLADIFTLFQSYMPGHQSGRIHSFLQLVHQQVHVRRMFLTAIYVGAYGIDTLVREAEQRSEEAYTPHNVPQQEYFHRSHGEVLDAILPQLKRQPFPMTLSALADIERAINERFGVPSFQSFFRTSFLDFVVRDPQCTAALGGSLTVGAPATDLRSRKRVIEIVAQLRPSERDDKEIVTEALKFQCSVTSVDQLCCGTVEKVVSDVNERGETISGGTYGACATTYLSPLLLNGEPSQTNSVKQWSSQNIGALGNKTKEEALSCLTSAPLLEDLSKWTHWDLVFKPQHGELDQFIEREGRHSGLHVLELSSGALLRIDPGGSHQKFLEALEAQDPVATSGQLVSIVTVQGSIHEVSRELLGSHVQTALNRMAVHSSESAGETSDHTLSACRFVYLCLVRIPLKICQFLANEVFLEPLRRATSSAAVEALLDQCGEGNRGGRRKLQALGMTLGIKAWTDDFSAMLEENNSSRRVHPVSKMSALAHTKLAFDVGRPGHNERAAVETTSPGPAQELVVQPTVEEENQPDSQLPGDTSLTQEPDPEREGKCRSVIDSIRTEDFGVGLKLEGKQKEVAEKQRQREGRGLQRLSKELYSKDTHFVLELIQNADDNSYDKSLFQVGGQVHVPALRFIIGPTCVTVLNNEVGFSEKNIRAICDVGRSTKGANQSGYIGQKGIGFKSVFRVTDTPEIHSNGYHIMFDAKCDAIGYILPHWIEESEREHNDDGLGWTTMIVLPLKEDQVAMSLVRKFQDIRPSLLLFLHRLRSITVEHKDSGEPRFMNRSDGSEGIITIEHNTIEGAIEKDKWLVVRKRLNNASQFKAEVEVTEVALAFPLGADVKTVCLAKDLQQQQVFAFLPLRSYGFRFIVQGDFDLPSSREDVNSDSVWNQFLRDEIPNLFLLALQKIQRLPDISVTDAVALYLQFVPLDGELHDFFKPVAIQIRNLLRGAACLPTESGSQETSEPFSIIRSLVLNMTCEEGVGGGEGGETFWKQPSELVVASDDFIRKTVPQSLLNSSLHYFYLNSNLVPYVSQALKHHLGLHSLSVDHLITVAEAVIRSYSNFSSNENVIMLTDDSDDDDNVMVLSSDSEDDGGHQNFRNGGKRGSSKPSSFSRQGVLVRWVAQWLACVHIVLEEEGDRSPVTTGKLKKAKIVPLTTGALVAAHDHSLFFPSDTENESSASFKALYDEIKVVDTQLFEAQTDGEETGRVRTAHRVHGLLEMLGVREMYPAEVIRHHILPSFQSELWKDKPAALLMTYLVYIRESLGGQGSGITEAEMVSVLRDCVALVSKSHGTLQPAREVIHLSTQYQPTYDLEKLFPDMKWKLVSPKYLKKSSDSTSVSSWRNFLLKLGVRDKIAIASFTETIPEDHERWGELRNFVGRSPDGGYTLRDYHCREFEEIVSSARSKHRHQQMLELLRLFDQLWDQEYRKFTFAKCYDGSNESYLGGDKTIPSAFQRRLRELAWLPAISLPQRTPYGQADQLYRGQELFDQSKANLGLLDCHVPYIASEIKSTHLLDILQVRCQVSPEEMVGFLEAWSRVASEPGSGFRASIAHMSRVYLFLYQRSQQMYSEGIVGDTIKDRLSSADHTPIFVPDTYDPNIPPSETVKGKFYSVHKVCWIDPSGVLYRHQEHNRDLPSDLPRVLQLHYGTEEQSVTYRDLKNALQHFGVRETPTSAAYVSTLQYISSLAAIPEKYHIDNFTSVALHLSRMCMKGEFSPEFLKAQLSREKVFPSHRDLWVSLDSCLLENDDQELEKVFSECGDVHFVKWPVPKKVPRYRQLEEQHKLEEKDHFLVICGIAKLSEIVESSVAPDKGMVMPLLELRERLHTLVPLIQRYLIANENDLYQSLLRENMKEKLERMFIASVLSLKCIYSIRYGRFSFTSPVHSSPGSDFVDSTSDDTAALYVVSSKVSSPKVLVPTLIKIFTGKHGKFQDRRNFEDLVKDMLLSPIHEVEESVRSEPRYKFGEVDDDSAWNVPYEEESESESPESESEEEEIQPTPSRERDRMAASDDKEDSDEPRCWPPMAPVSVRGGSSTKHPAKPPPSGSAVADVVGQEDIEKISEKYDIGSKRPAAARPPHNSSKHSHQRLEEEEARQHEQSDRTDRVSTPAVSSRNERPGSSAAASKSAPLSPTEVDRTDPNSVNMQRTGEDKTERQSSTTSSQTEPGTTGTSDTSNRNEPPTHNARDGRRREQGPHGWQETIRPGAAVFTHGSFSIASALQAVHMENAEDLLNRSFVDSCEQDSHELIGRWGEEYVYKYLSSVSHLPSGQRIMSVTWINEDSETGKPYDLQINIEPQAILYIEVKSTKSCKKEFMEFSWNELQFAEREKQNYHLYRVYSAGSELATLKWIENLSGILTTQPVRLFLEL